MAGDDHLEVQLVLEPLQPLDDPLGMAEQGPERDVAGLHEVDEHGQPPRRVVDDDVVVGR